MFFIKKFLLLNGLIPINRKELFELVDSWGRNNWFVTHDNISINKCDPKECYDLSKINVSNIKDLSFIFNHSLFNGNISKWNVSNSKNMSYMFRDSKFNGDISKWNTSAVTTMKSMFSYSKFNGDISLWNVSKVNDMENMFYYSDFNGNISNWNTISVINMKSMFAWSEFNGNLSNWNISNVKSIDYMFTNTCFIGDISKWNFNKLISGFGMFIGCDDFIKKYNNNERLSNRMEDIVYWLEKNRMKISNLNISNEEQEEINKYLLQFNI